MRAADGDVALGVLVGHDHVAVVDPDEPLALAVGAVQVQASVRERALPAPRENGTSTS